MGAGAKSYTSKGFLIYEEMHKNLVIDEEAVSHIWVWLCTWSRLNFLIYEENYIFFFISVGSPMLLLLLTNGGPINRQRGRFTAAGVTAM